MSNEVQQAKTLQERVGDRIRDQIGDLMTDADLKTLVDQALHDAFFKETIIRGEWGRGDTVKPAPAVALVRDLLKERVDAACATWLAEHKDALGAHIDEAIGNGMLKFFTTWLDSKVQQDLFTFGNNLRNSLGLNR